MNPKLTFHLPQLCSAFGLPVRLLQTRPFVLRTALQSVERGQQTIGVSQQLSYYTALCEPESGWLAYVLGINDMTHARVIAANVFNAYVQRDQRVQWLTHFDRVDRIPFRDLKLLVIDTLFLDSAPFRRDKIFEIINHNANVADCSVIVLTNNSLDGAIGQLSMRPDFVLGTRA